MQLTIDGETVFAATGGRAHIAEQPLAVFIHGAGGDHNAWALHSRWLAFRGWNVLAVDLPAHGRSSGQPLSGIEALSQWIAQVMATSGASRATLIGHSMESLIALQTAASHPDKVQQVVLIGAAAAIPVNNDLLAAAAASDHAAIDMVNLWGHGYAAGLGGSRAPGVWLTGANERTLERARPGVLHADLAACHAYQQGLSAAARIKAPTLLICGEKDQMTPAKAGRELADTITGAKMALLDGAGHMLMAERPCEVQDEMARFLLERRA